ncbi:MAG: BadF/BadG/BcrA/BcrD ATPase family protein [Candidatus Velthaea sp.]
MSVYLGIDGGQSSTTAVVMNDHRVVLGTGVAGPSDHVDEPPDSRRCADACEAAAARALENAGIATHDPIEAVVVGLSGYEGELHGVAPRFNSARVRFMHDAPVALAGAIEQRPAVVVIAGTGSVAYGERADGTSVRIGGYGYLFGDEGSSFALARAALTHAMAEDDRGVRTRIGEAATAFFDVPDVRALARAFYLRRIDRPGLATFARVVLDAARLGDPEANALVDDAAHALASLATIALERMDANNRSIPVAFIGGMMQNAALSERTRNHLALLAAHAVVVAPLHSPAIGAALLAVSGRAAEA